MRLLDRKRARTGGVVEFDGTDILRLPERQMPRLRGKEISMIFQEPMTSLSPLKTVGAQLDGAIANHTRLSAAERRRRVLELLDRVGLNPVEKRAKQYPFELSGGMQQRVMIAQAIACRPKLLIADEPTTALDVTIQAQILALLKDLQGEYGMSVLLVTHNFGVVSQVCDSVSVMYAGRIIESAQTRELMTYSLHPYTSALISCIPRSGGARDARLFSLGGSPPQLYERAEGCSFRPRCKYADEQCEKRPESRRFGEHYVLCRHAQNYGEVRGGI
jgi:oligopeptide/dipeptide ABC transporter ATP-binding protein